MNPPPAATSNSPHRAAAVRMPLQVGTTAFWALTRSAALLLPSFILFLVAIPLGAATVFVGFSALGDLGIKVVGALGVAVLTIILFLLMFVIGAIRSILYALRERPSDALFADGTLRIIGGAFHGKVVDIASADHEYRETTKTRAFNVARGGDSLTLGELRLGGVVVARAVRPIERDSLRAVSETIAALKNKEGEAAPPARADVLSCSRCRAAVAPDDVEAISCPYCGATVAVPAALREKIRAMRDVASRRPVNERRLKRLLDQPSATRTNAIMALLGVPILVIWPATAVAAGVLYKRELLEAVNCLLLAATAMSGILALFFLMRASIVNRQALTLVTLQFGAQPPAKAGAPYACRQCMAPLPEARDRMIARCAYCGAENVVGLDVRPQASKERKQGKTLEEELARRGRERFVWGVAALAAMGCLVADRWILPSVFKPHTDAARCHVGHDAAACLRVADKLQAASGKDDTIEAQLVALEHACDLGDAKGCVRASDLVDDDNVTVAAERAFATNEKACAAAYYVGCSRAGIHFRDTKGPDKNDAKAATLFRHACDHDVAVACVDLGRLLDQGRGVAKDLAAAHTLYTKACAGGSLMGCTNAAWNYEHGEGTAVDVARAARMYDDACARATASCDGAAGFHVRQCEAGDEPSCKKGVDLYLDSYLASSTRKFKTSEDGKQHAFTVGCAHGVGDACFGEALMLQGGSMPKGGSRASDTKANRSALALYEKACDAGSAKGCNNSGLMYGRGIAVSADAKAAHARFQKACSLGDKDGCMNLVNVK